MWQIRAIVIQPQDLIYPSLAKGVIDRHWVMARDWIELKAGVRLNWLLSPTWLAAPWTYDFIATEATRPGGNLQQVVFNWMQTDPMLSDDLRPRGEIADQSNDTWCVMVAGAGGWAGALPKTLSAEDVNWAIVGSGFFGPVLGANGLPEMNDCGNFFPQGAWQCEYGTAFGTAIHEVSHAAFGLDHGSAAENLTFPAHVMTAHWSVDPRNFAVSGYLPRHAQQIATSGYLQTTQLPQSNRFPQTLSVVLGGILLVGAIANK